MRLESPGDYQGAIFDCDGTLADTMPLHYRAWVQALADTSVSFEEELFYGLGGVPSIDIVRLLNQRHGTHLDPEETCSIKERIYLGLLPQARPIERVVELVHQYDGQIPLAVASGGLRSIVEMTLDALGIRSLFSVIATTEDVVKGKPEPDLFLYAAQQLGVSPLHCVVYEDSPLGLEAARRAGMHGIDIRSLL